MLGIRKSFLGGEFQIVHDVADLPPYVAFAGGFGVTNFILEGLERFGYPIAEQRTPVSSGVRPRLSWKPIAGPLIAAVWALVLAFLYRNRLLPSLSQPRILSGGKEISTAEFSSSMAHMFTVGAAIFALLALVFLAA